jgi:endo-1,4-beta-xylanase
LSLKKDLMFGIILGLVVGLVAGYAITAQQISDLRSQISGLQSQMEDLEENMPPLRKLADVRGILIGAAVAPGPLRDDPPYAETLGREFNVLVTENALKFEPVHPSRDSYTFDDADAIISFAEANDMKVRGHTLVWHQQLPSWVTTGVFMRDEWIEILREHIYTVVDRFRGRVYAWDVINEAVGDDGSLRDTVWLRGIGPEYLDMAFRWAHEADPEALLFYNDYGGEGLSAKSDAVYNLVSGLLERGVPIHGVGLQMHISLEWFPEPEEVAGNIRRLAELGLEVHITELDVRMGLPATPEKLRVQARVYRDMFEVCLSAESCTAFVMWGFTDRHSWVPWFFSGYGSALIFDRSYRPKPAYHALWTLLLGDVVEGMESDGPQDS